MWRLLCCSRKDLNLKILLDCGQSFRWKQKSNDENIWMGVLNKKLWLLKQTNDGICYQILPEDDDKKDKIISEQERFLRDYFQLDVDLQKLYQQWSKIDTKFEKLASSFCGIRILRQDPVENLFSFICSQNNNISRIKQLVENLCKTYGQLITVYDDKEFYSFPEISTLSQDNVEEKLRKLSFGYRAKFIHQTAKCVNNKNQDWLFSLRCKDYEEAHQALCSLPGVGPKVADCVCLMSLDKHDAIPVDTHMWQIAVRDYLPHLKKNKTVTNKAYKEIGDFFREMYGEYAGWAHSVLFSADLQKFKELVKETDKSDITDQPESVSKTLNKRTTGSSTIIKPKKKKKKKTK